jgi:hypothetical protein
LAIFVKAERWLNRVPASYREPTKASNVSSDYEAFLQEALSASAPVCIEKDIERQRERNSCQSRSFLQRTHDRLPSAENRNFRQRQVRRDALDIHGRVEQSLTRSLE